MCRRRRLAGDAAELAIQLLDGHRPDLIVADLELPFMSGLRLVRTLKADRNLRRIPVVLTGDTFSLQTVEDALAAGCEGFVRKQICWAGAAVALASGVAG